MTTIQDDRLLRLPRRHRAERRIVLGWTIAGAVALWLFWQLVTYSGMIALLAEWQFNTLGEYYPFLTYVLLALVAFSPLTIWSLVRSRRRGRAEERIAAEHDAANMDGANDLSASRPRSLALPRLLWAGSALALISALLALLLALVAPSSGAPPVAIDAGTLGLIPIGEGPAAITGRTLYGRVAGFDERLLFFRHTGRFAPMVAAGAPAGESGDDVPPLRLFVELPADQRETNPPAVGTRAGLVRQGGLPGEVIRLYRYAGYDVGEPYYVLFSSRRSLQWPMFQVAAQAAAVALLLGIGALAIQLLRRRDASRRRDAGEALPAD